MQLTWWVDVCETLSGKWSRTDYDICTSATPEKIQQLFQHTIPTGTSMER